MNKDGALKTYVSGHNRSRLGRYLSEKSKQKISLALKSKNLIGPNAVRWKGGKRIQNGYVLIYNKSHPKANSNHGYVREHILIMEKQIGRFLKENEVVHHINGNRQDNRIENLQLMTPSEHMRLHVIC